MSLRCWCAMSRDGISHAVTSRARHASDPDHLTAVTTLVTNGNLARVVEGRLPVCQVFPIR